MSGWAQRYAEEAEEREARYLELDTENARLRAALERVIVAAERSGIKSTIPRLLEVRAIAREALGK